MQVVLNKLGECSGCMYFNGKYDADECRRCERNPHIPSLLKDMKKKLVAPGGGLVPEVAFDEPEGSPLKAIEDANKKELTDFGIASSAIERLQNEHKKLMGPKVRPQK